MKPTLHFILILAAAMFASCDKAPSSMPAATPEPETESQLQSNTTQMTGPSTTPTPMPEVTPVVRMAPDGTLFVIKQFSVSLKDGLHGFPLGREVTLLSEDESNYTVTDGEVSGTAPKSNFTNNLDLLSSIIKKANADYSNAQKRALEQRNQSAQERTSTEAPSTRKTSTTEGRETSGPSQPSNTTRFGAPIPSRNTEGQERRKDLNARIGILKSEIYALNTEIRALQAEQRAQESASMRGAKPLDRTTGSAWSQLRAKRDVKSAKEKLLQDLESQVRGTY